VLERDGMIQEVGSASCDVIAMTVFAVLIMSSVIVFVVWHRLYALSLA
jgi:hypothetical protein